MKNKYFMAVEEGDTLDILIFGDITSWEWLESDVSSYTLTKLLQESNAGKIRVSINSYGGEVAEALAIYNELRNKSAAGVEVTTEDTGFACSAAAVIFCAGDSRIMHETSLLMIHHAWSYAKGSAKELRKQADDLEKISNATEEAFRRVMHITEEELEELLDNESWIAAAEALSFGFATEIVEEEKKETPAASVRGRIQMRLAGKLAGQTENGVPPKGKNSTGGNLGTLFNNFKKGERR